MAVVLKTVTSRSFGKASLPSGAAAPFDKSAKGNLRDQLSVILDAVIIKWYSSTVFSDESRYNAPVRAPSANLQRRPSGTK
jgi:hypothetical protein